MLVGGSGNKTMVVNDLDRSDPRVGDTRPGAGLARPGDPRQRGQRRPGRRAPPGDRVPAESAAVVEIRSSSSDSRDRLVVTGSDTAGQLLLTVNAPAARSTAPALRGRRPASTSDGTRLISTGFVYGDAANAGTIQAQEIPVRQDGAGERDARHPPGWRTSTSTPGGGDDRIAVQALHTRTTLNTGGSDAVYVGSKAEAGDPASPTPTAGGVLDPSTRR